MAASISPVPREARAYQGETAGLVSRVLANVVDALVVCGVLAAAYAGFNALVFVADPRSFEVRGASLLLNVGTALVVLVGYLTVAWAVTGRTYGDHVMGLRVVDRSGHRVHFLRALARAVLCVAFPIGMLTCLGRTRRSVQDMLLHTLAIYDWTPRHDAAYPGGVSP